MAERLYRGKEVRGWFPKFFFVFIVSSCLLVQVFSVCSFFRLLCVNKRPKKSRTVTFLPTCDDLYVIYNI